MDQVSQKISNLKEEFIGTITNSIIAEGELQSYEIVWKQLQDIAAEKVCGILKREFPNGKIIIPRSKSTYPDVKLQVNGKSYAIDIKCAEIQKNPWYDMARLDTFIESRINVYEEEWELLIQYDSVTKGFIKAFFGLFREFVGYNPKCDGVKYRPYDGKIRPKTWDEFENNIIYWPNNERFLEGIKNSQINRWKSNISQHLVPILTPTQKDEFKELFDRTSCFSDEYDDE